MALSLIPLLLHDDTVPPHARRELKRALTATADRRRRHLERAARSICESTDIPCADIKDLLA